MQPKRVERGSRVARQAAEQHHRPAGAHELDRVGPRLLRAGRLEHDVRPAPVARLGPERACERTPLLSAADEHRPATGVGDAGGEHQPDRPRAENRDGVARLDAGALDAAQAAGERLEQRGDLRREAGRDVVQIDRRDPLRHDEPIRVRTGEELQVAALLSARAPVAGAAGSGVGGDHTTPVDEPAELVPERGRRLAQQDRMTAAERLQIGSVGQRNLDLHEHLARAGLGLRYILDAQVAGRVETRGLHGVNTTFSAAPLRYSSTPSSNRSSGSVVASGSTSDGSSSIAAWKVLGRRRA